MKVSKCIALAVLSAVSATLHACSSRSAAESPAARPGQLAAAGHQAPAPIVHSGCGASDDAEGPYAEEADLLSICAQRALSGCESADGLCSLLSALPVDVEQRCSRPSQAVACVPAPAVETPASTDNAPALRGGALSEVDVQVCRQDTAGNTWAIGNLDAPPDWKPLPLQAPAEWQQNCEGMARCED
jgi:hypothetical protein